MTPDLVLARTLFMAFLLNVVQEIQQNPLDWTEVSCLSRFESLESASGNL